MEFKGLSKDLLTRGYVVRMNARGLSMFPLIWTGDRITISPEKNINPADVVVFTRESQMVCHSVVGVFERDGIKYYQTRGNSSFGLDEAITSEQILGKVTRIERGSMPFIRRILLLIHPILRVGRLNAIVTCSLVRIRSHLLKKTKHICFVRN